MKATHDKVVSAPRQARPFLYLDPAPAHETGDPVSVRDVDLLNEAVADQVPTLVRSLVNYTIELRNQEERRSGHNQPIAVSVLNRRRRAAREWIQAVLATDTTATTLYAFSRTWMPQLSGTGPDLVHAAGTGPRFIEYLRGAITALIFNAPADNLIPQARALYALEATLAVYLQAFRDAVEGVRTQRI